MTNEKPICLWCGKKVDPLECKCPHCGKNLPVYGGGTRKSMERLAGEWKENINVFESIVSDEEKLEEIKNSQKILNPSESNKK